MVIRIRIKVLLFLFAVLAVIGAIASVASGRESEPVEDTAVEIRATADETAAPTQPPTEAVQTAFRPRLRAPDTDDACYYSDENIFYEAGYGMPNCTCYAWGRVYELSGEKPVLSPYDAGTWYDYNKENGVYRYGDTPREGAIACWAYADGGPGHVAVVEEVDGDTVVCSNSAYSGTEFYLDTISASDPCEGRDNWIFQGYIYVKGAVRI